MILLFGIAIGYAGRILHVYIKRLRSPLQDYELAHEFYDPYKGVSGVGYGDEGHESST
jgi:hypothetical protein